MKKGYVNCPFKVGDIIKEKPNQMLVDGRVYDVPGVGHVATVTAVWDDSFDYEYPGIVPVIPRLGMNFVGGTCLPLGYEHWEHATTEELAEFKAKLEYWPTSLG